MDARVERIVLPPADEPDEPDKPGEPDGREAPGADGEQAAAGHRGSNAWLLGDDEEVIVIDPGEHAEPVLDQVGGREILAVICTHGHPGHVTAAIEVAERDKAPVALHRADRLLWRTVHRGGDPEIEMAAGGRFDVSDVQLKVIHTPGHTAGSVSLYCELLDVVFTGDALSARGPVPHEGAFIDFPRQLTTIGERLFDLPPQTRVLPGHGDEITIGEAAKEFDGWVAAGPGGEFN